MICIAAFIVLAIMGIFSATHRALAKEAFACVFKRITLKPCDSDFQTRVKSSLVSWLMKKNLKAASFVNKNAEALAWIFVIISLSSLLYTGYGLYNYIVHGSCTPQNPEQCVLKKSSLLERLRDRLVQ